MGIQINRYSPSSPARANVLICHGYAEHSGRYTHLVRALCAAKYRVWTYDQRGHGITTGRRALVNIADLVGDHQRIRAQISDPKMPLFLLGHSMGGLITGLSVSENPANISGAILSSPAVSPYPRPNWAARTLVTLIAKIAPTMWIQPADLTKLAEDPHVGATAQNDPLMYTGPITAQTAVSIVQWGEELLGRAKTWNTPTLVLQGGKDQLVDPQTVRQFVAATRQGRNDISYLEYANTGHENFNDYNHEEAIKAVITWLNQRTK